MENFHLTLGADYICHTATQSSLHFTFCFGSTLAHPPRSAIELELRDMVGNKRAYFDELIPSFNPKLIWGWVHIISVADNMYNLLTFS